MTKMNVTYSRGRGVASLEFRANITFKKAPQAKEEKKVLPGLLPFSDPDE